MADEDFKTVAGLHVEGDATVEGDLTVNGTTVSVNTETVTVDDNIIVLNNNEAGSPSQDAGVEIERGTSTNARIQWNETTDKWEAGLAGSEVELLTTADGIDALDDVSITSVAANEVLKWNGTAWINNTLAEAGIASSSHAHALNDISDVVLTSPTTGQVLKYNGTNWVNDTDATGGGSGDEIVDADSDTKIQVEEGTDDDTIRFDTLGSERMVIKSDGKIGIGTDTPVVLVDLLGGASDHTPLRATNASTARTSFVLSNTTAGNDWHMAIGGSAGDSNFNSGSFNIHEGGVITHFHIEGTTGDVGIGTTNPQDKLHIEGDNTNYTAMVIGNTTATGNDWYLGEGGSLDGADWPDGAFSIYEDSVGTHLSIAPTTGYVGIGTTSSPRALEVDGKTAASPFKATSDATSYTTMIVGNTTATGGAWHMGQGGSADTANFPDGAFTLHEAGVGSHLHVAPTTGDLTIVTGDVILNADPTSALHAATKQYVDAVGVSDLNDVTITSIASGELLKWNGTAWINNTLAEAGIPTAINDLSDVSIGPVASGELLIFNGSVWTHNTLAEAGVAADSHTHALNDISDVVETSPEQGHVLYNDGSDWVNGLPHDAGLEVYVSTVTPPIVVDDYVEIATFSESSKRSNTSVLYIESDPSAATVFSGVYPIRYYADQIADPSANDADYFLITPEWEGGSVPFDVLIGKEKLSPDTVRIRLRANTTSSEPLTFRVTNAKSEWSFPSGTTGTYAGSVGTFNNNNDLSASADVTLTSIAAGELLKWDGSGWINNTLAEAGIASTSHSHALTDLSDATITSPSSNQVLFYNGAEWVNSGLSSSNLSDVNTVGATDGEILRFNGSTWISNTLAEAGVAATSHVHDTADVTTGVFADARLFVDAGTNNWAVGAGALASHITGSIGNTGFGKDALGSLTTGDDSVGIGYQAGAFLTTGDSLTAVGAWAGSVTTGEGNTYLGRSAGTNTTTAIRTVAVGYAAASENNSDYAIAIGNRAMRYSTTNTGSIAIGSNCMSGDGVTTPTGTTNTTIGYEALENYTTASAMVAIGYQAAQNRTTGGTSVSIGYQAGKDANTNGTVHVGYLAGNAATGTSTVAIGSQSMLVATGASNVGVGRDTGKSITTGGYNVLMGTFAGDAITIGNYNLGIGDNALGGLTEGNNNVVLGYQAMLVATTQSQCIAIGTNTLKDLTTGGSDYQIAIGHNALTNLTSGDNNLAIGGLTLDAETTGSGNIAIGYSSLGLQNGGNWNTSIGYLAGDAVTTGNSNTFLGYSSGSGVSTGIGHVHIGMRAGLTMSTGDYGIAIGYDAGNGVSGSNAGSIMIGKDTYSASTGSNAVIIGHEALDTGIQANQGTIAIGYQAAQNVTGAGVVAIGFQALKTSTTATGNTVIGRNAADAITTGTQNVGIGYHALPDLTTGSQNVGIGYQAGSGATASLIAYNNCVAIGYRAEVSASTASNEIIIGRQAVGAGSNTVQLGDTNVTTGYIGDASEILSSKVAVEYTKSINFNATTLTDAATINWDVEANEVTSVTIAGNRTMAAPTNLKDGGRYMLKVIQDATGSRTLTWNAAFKWEGGTAPTLTTGSGAIDIVEFWSDGTNLYGKMFGANFS